MYHSPHSAGLWLHLKLSWELHYLKRMEEAWHLPRHAIFFLEHANKIIADCDVAVDKMQELSSNGGEIDIGYVFPLAGHYIPHKVRRFLENKENSKLYHFKGKQYLN